jgi:hypothetical protein
VRGRRDGSDDGSKRALARDYDARRSDGTSALKMLKVLQPLNDVRTAPSMTLAIPTTRTPNSAHHLRTAV